MKNLFIVIEGVDCSGKTTIGEILSKKISGTFYQTPSNFWRKHRHIVEEKNATIRFFYYLIATIFSSFEIRSLLKKSTIVCDRYIYSTWVYHEIYGFRALRHIPICIVPILKPDIVIYLYVDTDTRNKRLALRENNTNKDYNSEAMKKVHASFMKYKKFIKINTSKMTVDEVVEQILTKI